MSIQEALDQLRATVNELAAKKAAAQSLGNAIGNALGNGVGIWRSEPQINAMGLSEINSWGDSCEAFISEPD